MPSIVPVIAVIELSFDPVVVVGDWAVRLETLALAAVLFASLVLAALIGRRTPVDTSRDPDAFLADDERNHLRADDLLFIAVAAFPGAVAAGRLGYVLLHLDYYQANPQAILDTTLGGLQLTLAVVGGLATAAVVAALLGAPVGRWMHAAVVPVLVALGAGKAAMVLGGSGQGLPFDGPWALAFLGPGPWGSLAPEVPSHPSQVYEALATGAVILVLAALLSAGAFRARNGGVFLLGIALWASARALVATTWRDPAVVGPLNADQVVSIAVAVGSLILLGALTVASARRRSGAAAGGGGTAGGGPAMSWPDPASRPRI